jgi:hypothetical protein
MSGAQELLHIRCYNTYPLARKNKFKNEMQQTEAFALQFAAKSNKAIKLEVGSLVYQEAELFIIYI